MEPRTVPGELYFEVFAVMTEMANAAVSDDEEARKNALLALRNIYAREAALGKSDPFLTEVLADVCDDPEESLRLYQLALEQAAAFPDEPLYGKHLGMAVMLLQLERTADARVQLAAARNAALAAGDSHVLQDVDELEATLPSGG